MTSGDEVVEPGVRPAHGQIRNSNAALLSATLQRWGCRIVSCVHAGDDEGLLRSRLSEALANCDLLVTTGGASVGERDFMKGLLRQLGATFVFDSVALRPAKPSAFARYENVRVAVLPGNPSSAFVALHELVRLAALTLSGESEVALPRLEARLEGRLHGKAQRTYAAYASLHIASDGFVATPLDNQCSALTRTASEAAGFIIAPPGRHEYEPGDRVLVDVVDWSKLNH
ncbi:MAG: hypothetical protein JO060_09980 [Candidatus Eremiobacteraeota bacterium]|nr:hypothetical protein [Candidatus Eremiobacteraeota bacterium]